jgi:hypothetical protein
MDDWIICLEECLPELGINLDADKMKELARTLKDHASCMLDMGFEMSGGRSVKTEIDYKQLYEQTKRKLELTEKENTVFINSVANRHHVDPSCIRIENDSVMVYP